MVIEIFDNSNFDTPDNPGEYAATGRNSQVCQTNTKDVHLSDHELIWMQNSEVA